MANHGDYQLEIYFRGLAGVRESLPMTFAELERRAHAAMSEEMVSYVAGGAGNEHTATPTSALSIAGASCRECSSARRSEICR